MAYIFIWTILGAIGYKMAEDRGRDKFWGAVSCIFFSFLAMFYYLIVGDSKEKREKELAEKIKSYSGRAKQKK